MARNRRRMHHRAVRASRFAHSRFAFRISPQPQHQPLFFKVGEHCIHPNKNPETTLKKGTEAIMPDRAGYMYLVESITTYPVADTPGLPH